MAAGGEDREIKLWNAESGAALYSIPSVGSIISEVQFLPGGKRVAAIMTGENVTIWDVASKSAVLTLPGIQKEIRALACSPDGKHIATGGLDKSVVIWDVSDTGK